MNSAQQYKVDSIDLTRFPMRWKVESEKGSYLVDLTKDTCTCNHWIYRLSRNEGEARRCKHIDIARKWLVDILIKDQINLLTRK